VLARAARDAHDLVVILVRCHRSILDEVRLARSTPKHRRTTERVRRSGVDRGNEDEASRSGRKWR
ncbi:MAG: hypothetical protein ACREUC_07340, partial [Steroidobacteraceae bacterium]